MNRDELLKIIEKKRKVAQRNYDNYQQSGISQYYYQYTYADLVVRLAEQCLTSADDHRDATYFRARFNEFFSLVASALYHNNLDEYRHVLRRILKFGEEEFDFVNPYR